MAVQSTSAPQPAWPPLRAGKYALRDFTQRMFESLEEQDVEDIMYNNGMRLFAAKTREFCAAHPTPLEIVMPGQREKM